MLYRIPSFAGAWLKACRDNNDVGFACQSHLICAIVCLHVIELWLQCFVDVSHVACALPCKKGSSSVMDGCSVGGGFRYL